MRKPIHEHIKLLGVVGSLPTLESISICMDSALITFSDPYVADLGKVIVNAHAQDVCFVSTRRQVLIHDVAIVVPSRAIVLQRFLGRSTGHLRVLAAKETTSDVVSHF